MINKGTQVAGWIVSALSLLFQNRLSSSSLKNNNKVDNRGKTFTMGSVGAFHDSSIAMDIKEIHFWETVGFPDDLLRRGTKYTPPSASKKRLFKLFGVASQLVCLFFSLFNINFPH